MGLTFKENCPDTRNTKIIDIINRLKEQVITRVINDVYADSLEVKKYDVELIELNIIKDVDCLVVAIAYGKYNALSYLLGKLTKCL